MFSHAFAVLLTLAVSLVEFSTAKQIVATTDSNKEYIYCLYVESEPASRTVVKVDECDKSNKLWNSTRSDWDVRDDGSIRMKDFCLDVTGANFSNGTQVELFECLGNAAQNWTVGKDT